MIPVLYELITNSVDESSRTTKRYLGDFWPMTCRVTRHMLFRDRHVNSARKSNLLWVHLGHLRVVTEKIKTLFIGARRVHLIICRRVCVCDVELKDRHTCGNKT